MKRELSKILDFDEMINRSEGIALDIFGERKYSYSKYCMVLLELMIIGLLKRDVNSSSIRTKIALEFTEFMVIMIY